MTLEEAIQHCEEVSQNCENEQCALDHKQLKEWLLELKQYRELHNFHNRLEFNAEAIVKELMSS